MTRQSTASGLMDGHFPANGGQSAYGQDDLSLMMESFHLTPLPEAAAPDTRAISGPAEDDPATNADLAEDGRAGADLPDTDLPDTDPPDDDFPEDGAGDSAYRRAIALLRQPGVTLPKLVAGEPLSGERAGRLFDVIGQRLEQWRLRADGRLLMDAETSRQRLVHGIRDVLIESGAYIEAARAHGATRKETLRAWMAPMTLGQEPIPTAMLSAAGSLSPATIGRIADLWADMREWEDGLLRHLTRESDRQWSMGRRPVQIRHMRLAQALGAQVPEFVKSLIFIPPFDAEGRLSATDGLVTRSLMMGYRNLLTRMNEFGLPLAPVIGGTVQTFDRRRSDVLSLVESRSTPPRLGPDLSHRPAQGNAQ